MVVRIHMYCLDLTIHNHHVSVEAITDVLPIGHFILIQIIFIELKIYCRS